MPVSELSIIEARVTAFERAVSESRDTDFDDYLPPPGDPTRGPTVCELARVDLELRWSRGERPDLGRYLDRYPELHDPSALAEVAFEDYRQRLIAGDLPDRADYARRYGVDVADWPGPEAATAPPNPETERRTRPPDADGPATQQIVVPAGTDPAEILSEVSVDTRRLVEKANELPNVGQTVLGFRLRRELGRGAFGRVFLATQTDLADRAVAVKLSTALASEIRTLARLQHTNIVPVYSAHRAGPLQALCMPYFGGTTLGKALTDVTVSGTDRTGKTLADAVRRGQSGKVERAGPLDLYDRSSYVDAVLWVGERLADALAHAHDRGVVHRDIKPANVLLADDGQPMLLDFNLAVETTADAADKARIGGTLPYMAPEQLRAFGTGDRVEPDARADIYALGVVLFEALARRVPFPVRTGPTRSVVQEMEADRTGPVPDLRPLARDVTPAVEAIVRKCLAPDPKDRYQTAAGLRDDLARHRANQPLQGVREPSLAERAKKWGRRNRWLVSGPALTAYAAALSLLATAVGVRLSLDARADRQDRARAEAFRNYEDFLVVAERVKQAASSPAGSADVLRLSGPALDRIAATEPGWQDSDTLSRLPEAERERLKGEIGEVAYLAARAAARERRDAELAARLDALAANALPPDARTVLTAEPADGSRGSFLRACDLASRGEFIAALPLTAAVVASHPEDFGGWYLKARCHSALGQYEDARAAFSTAAALRPRSARTYAARAELAIRHRRDVDQALADLDRALELDRDLADARLDRALVRRWTGDDAGAIKDLDYLLATADAPTLAYFRRAEARAAAGDAAGAAADRAEGMRLKPRDPASYVERGLAKAHENDPDGALRDFQAAEQLDPNYPEAMTNQAWVYGEKLNRQADALAAVDRVLAKYPDHQNARGGRAVYLARLGRPKEAVAEAKLLLSKAPQPAAYYQAACTYALVSGTDPAYKAEGIRLVAAAMLRGFGHDLIFTDTDLDPLRTDAKFRTVAEGIRVMTELEAKK
ncbi:MAG TPA: protein kinase [Gemmataceae bacterium]|nr:protein kinase [Gemmataceae bacterium]